MRRKRGAKFMFKKYGLIIGTAAMLATTPIVAAQGPKGDEPVAIPAQDGELDVVSHP